MGLLGELARRLFGGGSIPGGLDGGDGGRGAGGPVKPARGRHKGDEGLYFYVRLTRTGEVVEIRLIPRQELVPDYKSGGYFSRKVITGPRTLARADAVFRFDEKHRFSGAEINGGELVERSDAHSADEAADVQK
jgi:hypothetical protein